MALGKNKTDETEEQKAAREAAQAEDQSDQGGQGDQPVSAGDKAELPADACPDCEGRGIRNPDVDHQVCQTCQGSGKV